MEAFLDTRQDCDWLREVHLKDWPLPASVKGFKCAVLQGNEDAPYAVNLYRDKCPKYTDDYYRVIFAPSEGIAFEAVMYNGITNKPYTGV